MKNSVHHHRVRLVTVLSVCVLASACGAFRTVALNSVAATLAAPPSPEGDVFSRETDPQLVREAVPFALKLYETLLESVPNNRDLLLSTCSAFTQYAYAFVQGDVDAVDSTDYATIQTLNDRAFNFYGRARGYCLRALERRRKGSEKALERDAQSALAWATPRDVPLLYWTAASWGSEVALGVDRPGLLLDVPIVRALFDRALALDEGFNRGAIHTVLIAFEARPETGGTIASARRHFERARALSQDLDPSPFLAFALGVSLPAGDRDEFVALLTQALAIDANTRPSDRLAALLMQARARHLLSRVDELFPSAAVRSLP